MATVIFSVVNVVVEYLTWTDLGRVARVNKRLQVLASTRRLPATVRMINSAMHSGQGDVVYPLLRTHPLFFREVVGRMSLELTVWADTDVEAFVKGVYCGLMPHKKVFCGSDSTLARQREEREEELADAHRVLMPLVWGAGHTGLATISKCSLWTMITLLNYYGEGSGSQLGKVLTRSSYTSACKSVLAGYY